MFLFLIFALRPWRPSRFLRKSVKINFDDPLGVRIRLYTYGTTYCQRFFAPLTLRSRMTTGLPRRGGLNSPSRSAKERGPGGEFRALLNRKVREERNVFFIFPWRSLRPPRFQGKSVKMNVDGPWGRRTYIFNKKRPGRGGAFRMGSYAFLFCGFRA